MSVCPNCGSSRNTPTAVTCSACGASLVPAAPKTSAMLILSGANKKYPLGPYTVQIGSKGCAILISDPGVCPNHASVIPTRGGYSIESIGGPVKVNGVTISKPSPLQPGDKIQIETRVLIYQGQPTHAAVPSPGGALQAQPAPTPNLPSQQGAGGPLAIRGGILPAWVTATAPEVRGQIINLDYKTHQVSNQYGSATYHYYWTRVDTPSGQVEVKYTGLPRANISLGDDVGFWGTWENGVLRTNRAFNYSTKAIALAPWYQWLKDMLGIH